MSWENLWRLQHELTDDAHRETRYYRVWAWIWFWLFVLAAAWRAK